MTWKIEVYVNLGTFNRTRSDEVSPHKSKSNNLSLCYRVFFLEGMSLCRTTLKFESKKSKTLTFCQSS